VVLLLLPIFLIQKARAHERKYGGGGSSSFFRLSFQNETARRRVKKVAVG